MENKALGNLGENIAKKYLAEKGYEILETNYKTNFGEIDIIAKRKNNFVFVEVKTRNKLTKDKVIKKFFRPEDNITEKKKKKIILLSKYYLMKKGLADQPFQIDVLSIEIDPYDITKKEITHLENAVWEE